MQKDDVVLLPPPPPHHFSQILPQIIGMDNKVLDL
jgi:hypothetical protein